MFTAWQQDHMQTFSDTFLWTWTYWWTAMVQSRQDNPVPVSTLCDEITKLLKGYCFLCLYKAFNVNANVLY